MLDVRAGQAVVTAPGEWVRYSSPEPGGAEYVAVCLPAFSPPASTATSSVADGYRGVWPLWPGRSAARLTASPRR